MTVRAGVLGVKGVKKDAIRPYPFVTGWHPSQKTVVAIACTVFVSWRSFNYPLGIIRTDVLAFHANTPLRLSHSWGLSQSRTVCFRLPKFFDRFLFIRHKKKPSVPWKTESLCVNCSLRAFHGFNEEQKYTFGKYRAKELVKIFC